MVLPVLGTGEPVALLLLVGLLLPLAVLHIHHVGPYLVGGVCVLWKTEYLPADRQTDYYEFSLYNRQIIMSSLSITDRLL